jgi:hypothetical protein
MFEAATFSAITTEALKYAGGRARPSETLRVNDWRSGGSSFPSLHTTSAFRHWNRLCRIGRGRMPGPPSFAWLWRCRMHALSGRFTLTDGTPVLIQ